MARRSSGAGARREALGTTCAQATVSSEMSERRTRTSSSRLTTARGAGIEVPRWPSV